MSATHDETHEPVDILLVDDRYEDLTAMKSILGRPEYSIVTATSAIVCATSFCSQ